jgi:hypothetical protein
MGILPSTDWHWRIRARLGYDDPPSYIQLLVWELTAIQVSPAWADAMAIVTLAGAALLSVALNVRDRTQVERG